MRRWGARLAEQLPAAGPERSGSRAGADRARQTGGAARAPHDAGGDRGPTTPSRTVPLRRRAARLHQLHRARPSPARVSRRGRRIRHGTTPVIAGRTTLAAAADRVGRRAGRERDVAPVHRRRRCRRRASRARIAVAARVLRHRRPARRGNADRRRGRGLRRALCRHSASAERDELRVACACAARARRPRTAPAREPQRQGLRADPAPARQRAASHHRRRSREAAHAVSPGARPRRPPARGHGVARLARGHNRARARAARRCPSSSVGRRPGSCCRRT